MDDPIRAEVQRLRDVRMTSLASLSVSRYRVLQSLVCSATKPRWRKGNASELYSVSWVAPLRLGSVPIPASVGMRLPGIDQVPEGMATDLADLKIPGSSPGLGKYLSVFFGSLWTPSRSLVASIILYAWRSYYRVLKSFVKHSIWSPASKHFGLTPKHWQQVDLTDIAPFKKDL